MIRLLIATILLTAAPVVGAERPARYAARLASGRRIESDRLTNWYAANAIPHLAGTPLLEPANPFRWLNQRTGGPADEPRSYVEFTNGDRLPGVVIDYRSGAEEPYHPRPPHLIVRVSIDFEPPENKPVPEIRVATQFVRRIVWQRREGAAFQSGTALHRDGRSLSFRAMRLKRGEAHVLLADGDRQLAWDELAELHLPAVDAWTAWFDQLAAVCPTLDTRLLHVQTSTGLIATASLACFTARFEGNSSDPDRWVHGLQPAWSLDILWIPFRDIATYRCFAAHEVPLSQIASQRVVPGGSAGGRGRVQVDRSVAGPRLRSKTLEFGWGFGVGSASELFFELPRGARTLQTSVCLDRAAEGGGCIRPRVLLVSGANRRPLWEGDVLQGSETVIESGPISLGGSTTEPKTLVLQIDPMISGRPPGADPLDIRDFANWCDPLLELDRAAVWEELGKRLAQRFVAWRGWSVAAGKGTPSEAGLELSLQATDSIPGSFEAAVRPLELPLMLRRSLTVGPHDNWLVIAATRTARKLPEPRLAVSIEGQIAGDFAVASGGGDLKDVTPLVVPLAAYRQDEPRTVAFEIRQLPVKDAAPVQYWAIATAEQIPTLQTLFEESGAPIAAEPQLGGEATIVGDARYSGARSLRLTPEGRFRIELPAVVPVRAAPQWGEARFIRFAVRKSGGGRVAIELEDARPRAQPARYDLGRGQPSYGQAVRVWSDPLPGDWVVVTRDLYADFGNVDVKSLVVGCPDGEVALIDHVYLARSRADFELTESKENTSPKRQ